MLDTFRHCSYSLVFVLCYGLAYVSWHPSSKYADYRGHIASHDLQAVVELIVPGHEYIHLSRTLFSSRETSAAFGARVDANTLLNVLCRLCWGGIRNKWGRGNCCWPECFNQGVRYCAGIRNHSWQNSYNYDF